MIQLHGKHAVVFGVASEDSIAWAIARRLHAAGATLSLGYQQRFKSRVLQLVKSGEIPLAYYERCDVTQPDEVAAFFEKLPGAVDVLVHSVAYASPETFGKSVSALSKEDFVNALIPSASPVRCSAIFSASFS